MNYVVHVSRTMWRIRKSTILTLLLVVTMPNTRWFLWRAYHIEDFKWRLHFAIWGCVLKGCVETWERYYILNGWIVFEGYWRLQNLEQWAWPRGLSAVRGGSIGKSVKRERSSWSFLCGHSRCIMIHFGICDKGICRGARLLMLTKQLSSRPSTLWMFFNATRSGRWIPIKGSHSSKGSMIGENRALIGEIFGHNRLRSECLQVQPVTCWHPPGFLS